MLKINKLQTSLIIAIGLLIIGLIINYLIRIRQATEIAIDLNEPIGITNFIQMILLSLIILSIFCFSILLVFNSKIKYKKILQMTALGILILFLLNICNTAIGSIFQYQDSMQPYSSLTTIFSITLLILSIIALTIPDKYKKIKVLLISGIFVSIVVILLGHILSNLEWIKIYTAYIENCLNNDASDYFTPLTVSRFEAAIDNAYCMNIIYYIALGINLITYIAYLIKTFAKSITYKQIFAIILYIWSLILIILPMTYYITLVGGETSLFSLKEGITAVVLLSLVFVLYTILLVDYYKHHLTRPVLTE